MFKQKMYERKVTKVQKRVSSLPTQELLTWADQVLYSIGKNLAGWQRSQNPQTLEEARLGAEVIQAITETLTERSIK